MQVVGKIEEIHDLVKRSETFSVREFVLEIQSQNSQYSEHVLFQVTNARTSMLDSVQVGQEVVVDFDLRGRKWVSPDNRVLFFNTLSAWRITDYAQQAQAMGGPMGGGYGQPAYGQQQPMGGFPQPGYGQQQPMGGFPQQQPAYAQPQGGFQQPAPAPAPMPAPAPAPMGGAAPQGGDDSGDLPF